MTRAAVRNGRRIALLKLTKQELITRTEYVR
jgi:hypothetical protein